MKMKKLLYILLVLGMTKSFKAQDFHLSLYDSGPLFLNPALTGLIDAKLRVHTQYRNQWSSVAFKPFTTALISGDMARGKWGYGAQIINMRAGIGNYNVFQFLGSTAYSVPIDKNKYHGLSFGLQFGFTQKSVKEQRYSFDNQYTPTAGGTFNQDIDNGEDFRRISQILPQLNAGFMYYYAKQQALLNPFLGISGFNLTHSKETFFDQPNRLPIRYTIHTGVRINITEELYVLPKILIMKQGKATEQTYACDAGYYIEKGKVYLLAGFVFRTKDASIVSAGVKKEEYTLKFGYDFNTSTLKTVTNRRGAYEISLTYLLGKEKMKKIKHCPRI
jgi:type IX secretion system PorP/SprF family membrane protein